MASRSASHGRGSFGADPAGYDAARPAYPGELFAWLAASCGLSAGDDCFEIGAGTGSATLPVLDVVKSVLAIEPDERLAERLREKVAAIAPERLTIAVQEFESCALAAGSFDFGFAATSFHWIPRGKGLAKVRAALKPGGWFAMWWSVYDDPERPDAFSAASADLFEGLEEGSKKAGGERKAFGLDASARLGELRSAGFVDGAHKVFRQALTFSPAGIAALYGTLSRVAGAPEAVRTRLLEGVERVARERFGGVVEREIATSAFVARRPP